MSSSEKKITDIILDFDGTCTIISAIQKQFLKGFQMKLNEAYNYEFASDAEWLDAQSKVREVSPHAGWMLGGAPAAPAAADPFILADESAKFLLRKKNGKIPVPSDAHSVIYSKYPAPWRDEALEIFKQLLNKGIKLHFISNSGTEKVKARVADLFTGIPENVTVTGNAAKFRICGLNWDNNFSEDQSQKLPADIQKLFTDLPAEFEKSNCGDLKRPVYLQRGSYFEAIYNTLGEKIKDLSTSLFCGDICEMDLAMPYYMGGNIHLIEREEPFPIYAYEKNIISSCGTRAKMSPDLNGIMEWFK